MIASYKKVLLFALPVALSNITEPLLGAVDTAILGHLPSAVYLSGVAIGAELFTFVTWMFGFLRMGTTAATAPALGKGEDQAVRDTLVQALFLSLFIGLLLMALSVPILSVATSFFGATADVSVQMRHFFFIRILSAPASLANMAILGWLLGMQKARAPLALVLVTNGINVVLDLWFVWGLGLNTRGVALGSLIATYCALLLSLYLVFSTQQRLNGHFRIKAVIRWSAIKTLLKVNQQLFVRTLCLLIVFASVTAWGAREGVNVLAANTILLNLLLVSACFLDGVANAAEAQIGKVTGKGSLNDFFLLLKTTGVCSGVLMVGCALIFWLGSGHFVSMFTVIAVVKSIALSYYPWLIVLPLAAGCSYWLDGVFIGMGRTDMMQYMMLFSVCVVFVPLCWLLRHWGNSGLWITLTVFMIARSLSMAWALRYKCIPDLVRKLKVQSEK